MRLMFIGDIFAKSGRRAIKENLLKIKQEENIDLVFANAENVSHGRSMIKKDYDDLLAWGIDVFTMGNHTWDITSINSLLQGNYRIIRPWNINPMAKENQYGNGSLIYYFGNKTIQITNLVSQHCLTKKVELTNPFVAMEKVLSIYKKADIHIVDFHAETTSEKKAFLYNFAGRVSMIVGTHTHVQTSDEQIYNNTAYITDLGMCGAKNSIIGAKPDEIIEMFKGERERFHLEPSKGEYQFNSVIVDFDDKTNIPKKIFRFNINNN